MKTVQRWFSDRLQDEITVVRWGTFGRPVLVFPSAGGDAEEIERFGLVDACGQLLAEGRIKLYSVDSVAGRAMVAKEGSAEHRMWLLSQFQELFHQEEGDEEAVLALNREFLSDNVIRLLRESFNRASDHQRQKITPMDLLISLLTASNSIVAECFERIGVTAAKLTEMAVIAEQRAGK